MRGLYIVENKVVPFYGTPCIIGNNNTTQFFPSNVSKNVTATKYIRYLTSRNIQLKRAVAAKALRSHCRIQLSCSKEMRFIYIKTTHAMWRLKRRL